MSVFEPILQWDFVVAGFTQRESQASGWHQLWRKLNRFSSDARCVEFKTWHQRWDEIADMVQTFAHPKQPPVVRLFGYSYGGFSSVKLARALKARGIEVASLLLADAVYRAQWLLGWWRSMVAWPQIVIPANVRRVVWFRQFNPRFALRRSSEWVGYDRWWEPAGHDVVAENPEFTQIDPVKILSCEHTSVDDAPMVHAAALKLAGAT